MLLSHFRLMLYGAFGTSVERSPITVDVVGAVSNRETVCCCPWCRTYEGCSVLYILSMLSRIWRPYCSCLLWKVTVDVVVGAVSQMKAVVFLFMAAVACSAAAPQLHGDDLDALWEMFKKVHSKHYHCWWEEHKRYVYQVQGLRMIVSRDDSLSHTFRKQTHAHTHTRTRAHAHTRTHTHTRTKRDHEEGREEKKRILLASVVAAPLDLISLSQRKGLWTHAAVSKSFGTMWVDRPFLMVKSAGTDIQAELR